MKRLLVLTLVSSLSLWGSGGTNFDGTNDAFTCGTAPNFDTTEDYVNVVVWFAPNWADSDTGTQYTILDAFQSGTPSTGYRLFWNTSGDFVWEVGDDDGSDQEDCTIRQSRFGPGGAEWSAGTLLGAFMSVADNVQNCTIYVPSTELKSDDSSFAAFNLNNGSNTLHIGEDSAGANHYDGDLFMIVLTNSRINSRANNRLEAVQKSIYYPMYQAQPSVQSIDPDPIGAWVFERPDSAGVALTAGDVMHDITGLGTDCTVITGATPEGVGSLMMR